MVARVFSFACLLQAAYPKKFPFSEFVPAIFEQVKAYARGALRFMEQLGLSQSEVDDTTRRYANVLLERLSGSLRSFVADRRLTLVQVIIHVKAQHCMGKEGAAQNPTEGKFSKFFRKSANFC